MRRWLLIRHGESEANAEGWLAGHRDVALTPRGEAQARALRQELADVATDRVFASDLQRAWRTAELAFDGEVSRVPGLRERNLGSWEGRSRASLVTGGLMPVLLTWSDSPPGGESQHALATRVLAALDAIETDAAGTTAVVVHGGVLRVLEGLHLRRPRAELGATRFENAEVLDWRLPLGTWRALANDLGEDGTAPAPGASW